MKKLILILLIVSFSTLSKAQAKFFSLNGKRFPLAKGTTVGKFAESLGLATQFSVFNYEKEDCMAFYIPLSHQPLAFECKDSLMAIKLVTVFPKKEKYFGTYLFEMDFKKLKTKYHANLEFITQLIGQADRQEVTQGQSPTTTLYYDKYNFQLIFENGMLDDFQVYSTKDKS